MSPGPESTGTWPSLDEFQLMAKERRVIPVIRQFLADGETPVGLYRKLAKDRPGTFLLESSDINGTWSRYSIIGVNSIATLTARDGQAVWLGEVPPGVPTAGLASDVLEQTIAALATPHIDGLSALTSGMVGFIAYDLVRQWERVPELVDDELGLPELSLGLASEIAVLDHTDSTVHLVANTFNVHGDEERAEADWRDAVARLDAMAVALLGAAPSTVAAFDSEDPPRVRRRTSTSEYLEAVARGQEAIREGEAFQIVLSQRFEMDCPVDALDVYRCLRASNPSPYMYLLRCLDANGAPFDVVGSSPEALVKVKGEAVLAHPIAGTRPRGSNPDEDVRLAQELLADTKERAEHVMLVDLARNDLGRIGVPGTVNVVEFMEVERYSHVMHLVSTVAATRRPECSAYDVLRATFPAGTLSGAPKPRALELIEEIEPSRRGLYGGTVGYIDFAGDLDMAIAIRTAVIRDGVAYIQAGAGIVADSVPEMEEAECQAKAASMVRAIATATSMRSIP